MAALSRRFGEALRAGDPGAAERVVDEALAAGVGAAALPARLIAPALRWIGELWQYGAVTVADEHLATAISHDVLARIYPLLLRAQPRSRERILVSAVRGERHALALRMVADVLEGAGFDVLHLGADTPTRALVDACRRHRPRVVALGITMPMHLPALIAELTELSALAPRPAFLLGGQGIPPGVGARLDAPVMETSEQAPAAVDELLARPAAPPVPDTLRGVLGAGPPPMATAAGPEAESGTTAALAAATEAAAGHARAQARRAFELEAVVLRDALTGLWNRRAFEDRFGELAERCGGALAVLAVDVDRLRAINDEAGDGAGDAALAAVARVVANAARPGDLVARVGSDEVVAVLAGADAGLGASIAERIRHAVAARGEGPAATVSIGVAGWAGDAQRTALEADHALLEAKAAGRDRVVVRAS